MLKIGIMGGTFNPIHNGHLKIAQAAYHQFHLDEVWFMPNHIPAYKTDKDIVPGDVRLEMVSLAVEPFVQFKASDFEISREGKTYTYETMQDLASLYPHNRFYFIMGADSLLSFDKWKHPEKILQFADILVAVRGDTDIEELNLQIHYFNNLFETDSFHMIRSENYSCSSSEIRKRLKSTNKSILQQNVSADDISLPDKVYQYIIEHDLYF